MNGENIKGNKKIGVTTFHHAKSIGANLQTYALQQVLIRMGYDVESIDYNRYYTKKDSEHTKNIFGKIKRFLITIFVNLDNFLSKKKHANESILNFRNSHLLIGSKQYNTIEELKENPPIYDYYITGSDQVWNPTTRFDEVYYLTFVGKDKAKIAYAPSIGIKKIPEKFRETMKEYISDIDYLSCREKIGAHELSELTKRKVETVLDPTLLLTEEDYKNIIISPKIKKPYVLCYMLGSMSFGRKVAKRIAKKNDYDIVIIPSSPRDLLFRGEKIKGVGPKEFLGLFQNASFICTDSFHGAALAINFEKQFYCFSRRNHLSDLSNISRLENIVELLGINERLLYPNSVIDYDSKIKYSSVTPKLNKEREKSILFLSKALKD